MFLGDNLLTWMLLALGGAMAVGNIAAIVRPPEKRQADTDLDSAPVIRSLVFATLGALAAVWALASLIS